MKKHILYIILFSTFFSCQNQKEKTRQGQLQFVKSHLKYGTEKGLALSERAIEEWLVKKVKRGGNSLEGRERLQRARESMKDLKIMLLYIQNLKTQLKKEAKTSQKLDRQIVKDFMLGKVQNGKKLRLKLEKYVEMLYKKYGDLGFSKEYGDFPSLTFSPKEIFKINQTYEEYEFSNCTLLECQNILNGIKNDLIRYNQMVLKKLGADDLARGGGFSRIIPFANSEVEIIKLGKAYKANLRLTVNSSRLRPKIFLNGQAIKIHDNYAEPNYIQVDLPTNKVGEFDYNAQIKFNYFDRKKEEHTDTTILITEKYKVIP